MESYPLQEQVGKNLVSGPSMYNPTIGENIDRRIAELKAEIQRLEAVKATLPEGLVACHIHDLRQAMNI